MSQAAVATPGRNADGNVGRFGLGLLID